MRVEVGAEIVLALAPVAIAYCTAEGLGAGYLVNVIRDPEGYGFTSDGLAWHAPPLSRKAVSDDLDTTRFEFKPGMQQRFFADA